tara:strand:- start:406 stop:960 length:555 start_codon:yes stop_codon:yes gene_type:complete
MPNNTISYGSVNEAIDDAVAKYKNNESIDDILYWINQDTDLLTGWAYETETFFNDDWVFLTSEAELFLTNENVFDYFEEEQLVLKTDAEILGFVAKQANSLFDDAYAGHFQRVDKVFLTATCESSGGQGGVHFRDFNICNSKEEYFESLVNKGCMLWLGRFLSHSNDDLISMFKKNITDKYFKK